MYGYNPELYKTEDSQVPVQENSQVARYVDAYRRHGYKYANLNPVSLSQFEEAGAELECGRYGLVSGNDHT